ncbi:MAG TPA: DUF5916 domain-containing protein [Gammaproteobacteria bacterium]
MTDRSTIGPISRLAPAFLALLHAGVALAQGTIERKVADIVRVTQAPVIDGVLDEAVWQSATVIRDLHQYDPVDHGAPSEDSVFYVMYDDDNLYVGAHFIDSEPDQIAAKQLIQGQAVGIDDRLELILDPFNNMRAGYKFQLNPNGVRRDGIFERATEVNADWDGIWDAAAEITDDGWTAEIAIPFKTLNFDPNNPDWGFTVGRAIPRKQEKMAWTSYDRAINLSGTGVLSGFENLRQGRGLDVIPALSIAGRRDYANATDDSSTDPSLDVFYNFTPSLTGVLTLNTDFSSTEVDDRQVNLSRFSAFFPEKRDFFLQDVDLFSFGDLFRNGIPFFSRRIGLSASGQPVDLDVGGKLTGRIGRWNVGVLGVQQASHGDVDESDLFVGRVAANVFDESSVGMIVTHGNPRSNLDNSVVGADFRYRNTRLRSGRTVEAAAWYQESDSEGIDSDEASYGVTFRLPANDGLAFESRYEAVESNFDPALGFLNRSNYERIWLSPSFRHRPRNHPWLRSYQTQFSFSQYDNKLTGDLESRWFSYRPLRLENHRGDRYDLTATLQKEVLVEPFEISEGVVIPVGEYDIETVQIAFQFASDRVVSPRLTVEDGDYYGGSKLTLDGRVDWRPSSRWYLSAGYEYNDIELPVGDFTTRLIQLRANVAFNVRWSWVNLLQYDNISDTVGLNSRLRFNPRAGEDLYIVWNHNSDAVASFSGLSSRASEFTIKYSRTFRF